MAYSEIDAPIPAHYKKSDGSDGYRWANGRRKECTVIVLHYDAGFSAEATRRALINNGISCHITVDRNGDRHRHVADQHRTWHAGKSEWLGLSGVNHFSLGAEITNVGWLNGAWNEEFGKRQGLTPYRFKGEQYVEDNVTGHEYYRRERWGGKNVAVITSQPVETGLLPDHRENTRNLLWAKYSPAQIESICEMVKGWLLTFPTILPENIVGHEHIAPTRKLDPGPAFRAVWLALEKAVQELVDEGHTHLLDHTYKRELRVKAMQSHLSRLGFYRYGIDGVWGKGTQAAAEEAIRLFGDDYGISDIIVSPENVTTICYGLRLIPGYDPDKMTARERSRLQEAVGYTL